MKPPVSCGTSCDQAVWSRARSILYTFVAGFAGEAGSAAMEIPAASRTFPQGMPTIIAPGAGGDPQDGNRMNLRPMSQERERAPADLAALRIRREPEKSRGPRGLLIVAAVLVVAAGAPAVPPLGPGPTRQAPPT